MSAHRVGPMPTAREYAEVQRALRDTARRPWLHADAYVEDTTRLTARHSDSAIIDLLASRVQGCCVRWLSADEVRYHASDATDPGLVARLVRSPAERHAGSRQPAGTEEGEAAAASAVDRLTRLLAEVDRAARRLDPRVRQVLIESEHQVQRVVTVTVDAVGADVRHLLYLTIRVVAEQGGRVSTGFYTPATSDPAWRLDATAVGEEVARRAVVGLDARPAPIAHLPVVVGPGRGMVLVHEACCHPLEGDEVLRSSIYAGSLGTQVAAPCLSLADDPLVPVAVGSYRHDDEGTPARRTVLVQEGRLQAFLTDRQSAIRLGREPSGNGRREGYQHMALPRMSNTCVEAGPHDPESIISGTDLGLYAQHVGGGEVAESTGDFVFRVTNGFLIERGRLTDPVGETTVRGSGPQVLKSIDAVGNDVCVGAARCGKFGQFLPVGVIGPTLRIGSLLVGGTEP